MSRISNQSEQQRQKRVLISFPSYDQDSWEYKKNDESFLNSFMIQGKGKPNNRHQIWRPSVALANLKGLDKTYKDLLFDEYYLLWEEKENHPSSIFAANPRGAPSVGLIIALGQQQTVT